jgi:diguanylate cyclase (GGDEF)-like protein/PAS domain S-box-containing protein
LTGVRSGAYAHPTRRGVRLTGRWLAFLGRGDIEARFRALAEMDAISLFVFDESGLRDFNAALVARLGRSRDEVARLPFWELAHPAFLSGLKDRGLAALHDGATQSRWELKLATSTGEGRWVDLTLVPLREAGLRVVIGMAIDIGEAKLTELALRESERRLRDILENVEVPAVFLDASGYVTSCNERLLSLVGYAEDEVVGQDWFERFIPPDERSAARQRFLDRIAAGAVFPHESSDVLTRGGERRRLSFRHTLLRDVAGRPVGTACLGSVRVEEPGAAEQEGRAALTDTGLPDRKRFLNRVAACLARARRLPSYRFAVLVIDVDRLQVVNASLGRAAGDRLLAEMGQRLQACLRPSDALARLEGDEFAILIDNVEHEGVSSHVAGRVQGALTVPFLLGDREVFVTASIGIVGHRARYEQPEEMLRDADIAVHLAKSQGKARQQEFQTAMHARAIGLLHIENDLHRAIERGELLVHYQPIISLKTDGIVGFEGLVRWQHPEHGLLAPGDFLRLAEENGLIIPISFWVLEEACRQLRVWQQHAHMPSLMMSINLSARQFAEPDLVKTIQRIVRDTGVSPACLKLEITESALMEDPATAATMLAELRAGGIDTSIDDFGTGYSSLSYLLRLPVRTLKIDGSFVSHMTDGGERAEMVRAIVSLARSLKMDVVAEGVETAEQLAGLRALGCDYVQGYFLSRPLAAAAALDRLLQEPRPGGFVH